MAMILVNLFLIRAANSRRPNCWSPSPTRPTCCTFSAFSLSHWLSRHPNSRKSFLQCAGLAMKIVQCPSRARQAFADSFAMSRAVVRHCQSLTVNCSLHRLSWSSFHSRQFHTLALQLQPERSASRWCWSPQQRQHPPFCWTRWLCASLASYLMPPAQFRTIYAATIRSSSGELL